MGDVVEVRFGKRPTRISLEQRKRDLLRHMSDLELRTLFQCYAGATDPEAAAFKLHRGAAEELRRRGLEQGPELEVAGALIKPTIEPLPTP